MAKPSSWNEIEVRAARFAAEWAGAEAEEAGSFEGLSVNGRHAADSGGLTVSDPRLSPSGVNSPIPFKVIPAPRRKRIAFRLDGAGDLEVLVPPPGLTEAAAAEIVARNLDLVRRMKARFARQVPAPVYAFEEGESFPLWDKKMKLVFSGRLLLAEEDRFLVPAGTPAAVRASLMALYRKIAPALLRERCAFFGQPYGLRPRSVRAADTTSRWGSCSSSGTISFCWKLLLLPQELSDYVVCHELAHLEHMDHSPAFWALTERLMPGAQEKRARLKALPEQWPSAPER